MRCPCCGQCIDDRIKPEVKDKAIKLYCEGSLSLREISKELNNEISPSSISRLVRSEMRLLLEKRQLAE